MLRSWDKDTKSDRHLIFIFIQLALHPDRGRQTGSMPEHTAMQHTTFQGVIGMYHFSTLHTLTPANNDKFVSSNINGLEYSMVWWWTLKCEVGQTSDSQKLE